MRTVLILFLAFASVSCSPTVDLATSLDVNVVETGWYDAGIVNGQNKLVTAARVTVKNNSAQNLPLLQLNSVFRRVNETEEWGTAFVTAVGSEGLGPGATKGPILLRSTNGYTGSDQSRQDMLNNSQFIDAKVQLFAKYASIQWVRKGEFPVERKLLEK